jgi:hypothetical protein
MTEEKFGSPGNRVLGGIGAVLGLAAIVTMLAYGPGRNEAIAIFVIALLVVLCWAYLVRPQLRLTESALTLRNPLETIVVPIQLVRDVDVRRFTVVRLEEGGFASPAVARMAMQIAKADRGGTMADAAEFMLSRIRARMDESAMVPLPEGAGVRRSPAWLEIGLLVGSALGLVVSLLA